MRLTILQKIMDIHRCRFVPYPPSAINALAFSKSSSHGHSAEEPLTLRLAIGRVNGNIELWNPNSGSWYLENVFRGGKDRSIEGLVWTQDPDEIGKNGLKIAGKLRLFSIGYSIAVTEWDLATGKPARHASGNFGDLWCIAAQPRGTSTVRPNHGITNGEDAQEKRYQSLAVGCADGSIVLLSTSDGDLQFQRTLARPAKRRARVLSIAWQDQRTVVTGHADSTIRIFDAGNGYNKRSMSLGTGPQGGPKEILVWSIKCLSDGTIVSGDSTGTVTFWDAKHHSRFQRITSHRADILALAVSIDDETVMSGGMDRRTTLYRRTAGSTPKEKRRWVEVSHQRMHKHDVKAMATFEGEKLSIMISGGLDTLPVVVPIREFGKEYQRALSNLPHEPHLRSSPKRRLLMSWWDREVNIWKIKGSHPSHTFRNDLEESPQDPSRRLIAKIVLQVNQKSYHVFQGFNC